MYLYMDFYQMAWLNTLTFSRWYFVIHSGRCGRLERVRLSVPHPHPLILTRLVEGKTITHPSRYGIVNSRPNSNGSLMGQLLHQYIHEFRLTERSIGRPALVKSRESSPVIGREGPNSAADWPSSCLLVLNNVVNFNNRSLRRRTLFERHM